MTWNKFNAKKIQIQGETFDSMAEARRWRDLVWMQRGGVISGLQRQVVYMLLPKQFDKETGKLLFRGVEYIADFVYYEGGQLVVEDVKGYKEGPAYALFKIKQKMMFYFYGIIVKEVQ